MKIFLMNVGLSLIIKVMSGVWVLTKDGHIIISFEAELDHDLQYSWVSANYQGMYNLSQPCYVIGL
jgi:hypothetical protein